MKSLLFGLFLVVTLSSCSLIPSEPYITTNYYDIGFPEKMRGTLDYKFKSINFQVMGPYRERMVFRRKNNVIAFGEYNRWSPSPAQMFERYFVLAYDDTAENISPDRIYKLNGKIMQLEADLETKTVNIILSLTVEKANNKEIVYHNIFQESVSISKVTGDSFAKSVQTAVSKIVADLDKKMN